MTEPQASYLTVGTGADARQIAYLHRPGAGPTVVWLGGFRSDMRATKATELDRWAAEAGRAFLRFDYGGHGESGGRFEDCTISSWLEDVLAVLADHGGERPILVGSSMGGWMTMLAMRALRAKDAAEGTRRAPSGIVLIAPAVDFTERLMWASMPEDVKATIERDGVWLRPSEYSPDPYPITKRLIEDGRSHLMLDGTIETGCPVHILQGMQDPDVPWDHAMTLIEHLPGDSVTLTLIKDGDHRLSRPQDLMLLVRVVAAMGTDRG